MKKVILAIFIVIGINVNAQTDVYLNIEHFLGSAPFAFNTTGINNLSQEFQVTRLQYYVAEIKLIHDGGTETMIPNLWILVDASSSVNQLLGNFNVTNLEGVEFGIGVENAYNHLDPAGYSVLHPLGPKSPSMHWGWSAGYRFLAMEGKTGTNFNLTFEIHALGDGNYNYVSLATTGSSSGSSINIDIDADYEMVLKDIDVSTGPISHGETGIAATSLLNCKKQVFSIAPAGPNGVTEVSQSAIKMYPNPTSGILKVEIDETINGKMEIEVLDVRGQIVLRKELTQTSNNTVKISNNGLYLVNVLIDGQRISTERVVVFK